MAIVDTVSKEVYIMEMKQLDKLIKDISESPKFKSLVEDLVKEDTKSESGRWKPENKEDYWLVDNDGGVLSMTWGSLSGQWYEDTYKMGNVYQTKAAAELARDRQLLLVELRDFAGNWEPDWNNWNQPKNYIYFDCGYQELTTARTYSCEYPGVVYFESEELAYQAIAHFGDRLKILFGGER